MRFDFNNFLENEFLDFLKSLGNEKDLIWNHKSPKEVKKDLDFSLDRRGSLSSKRELIDIFEKINLGTPKASHPLFLNYLYSKPDEIGILGDWLTSLINSNVHAYEASPFFSVVEVELIRKLGKVAGFDSKSEGIFCPGGSYSNFLAMYCAKRNVIKKRKSNQKLAVFTSSQAHYSIDKAALVIGLEDIVVYKVKCDKKGRMLLSDLKNKVSLSRKNKELPFFICATSGTTVLGGFDPIEDVCDFVQKNKLKTWVHVDAAWGGPILFSKKHKNLIKGVERADSLTWDFHKAMGAPILCSALILKDGKKLQNMFNVEDSYLFHDKNEESGEYEMGQKTFQCGRRGDAFKFWLMWKFYGSKHFEKQMELKFLNRKKAIKLIKKRKKFLIYDENPDFLNICFWYLPKETRNNKEVQNFSEEEVKKISKITKSIYKCLKRDGRALVNFAKIDENPDFIRLITSNPRLNVDELNKLLDIIESIGEMLEKKPEELLVSGGDERLFLDKNGVNKNFISSKSRAGQISRASCTSSRIDAKGEERILKIVSELKSGERSFFDCMEDVHLRIRKILKADKSLSIMTVPSGTDAEYIPILISKVLARRENLKIKNIITGSNEIGSNSALAASGKYFNSQSPKGSRVAPKKTLIDARNMKVIEIYQRDPVSGKPLNKKGLWRGEVIKRLKDKNNFVILHILESSKLGYRIDAMKEIEEIINENKKRILVVVDACQSRTDIKRVREYINFGCTVMITGSKFEESPPFCGAVLIPYSITERISIEDFRNFPKGLRNFVTIDDASGPIKKLMGKHLGNWMNWGLMLRWTIGLDNWERYRKIRNNKRDKIVSDWVKNVSSLVEKYPEEFKLFSGGEKQLGSVGDINTILSLEVFNEKGKGLSSQELRIIYEWMTLDMSNEVKFVSREDKRILRKSFIIGQPVKIKNHSVLRIALGARLAISIDDFGLGRELEFDKMLLRKLSLLVRFYRDNK